MELEIFNQVYGIIGNKCTHYKLWWKIGYIPTYRSQIEKSAFLGLKRSISNNFMLHWGCYDMECVKYINNSKPGTNMAPYSEIQC